MLILSSRPRANLVSLSWSIRDLGYLSLCPLLCIPPARKYTSLKIVLAHAGFAVFSAEAQVAASVCSNLYLETSWCIVDDIEWMISTIGSKRVMMGSDLIRNIPVEVAKYKALDLKPDVWAQVMGQTAIDVFRLPM